MSDLTQKILMIAGGLAITALIITIFFGISRSLTDQVNTKKTQQERVTQTLDNYDIIKYENSTIYGSDAKNYVRLVIDKLTGIVVETETGVVAYSDGLTDSLKQEAKNITSVQSSSWTSDRASVTSDSTFDPLAEYTVHVFYNANGVPTLVVLKLN